MSILKISGSGIQIPSSRPKKVREEKNIETSQKDRVEVSQEAQTKYIAGQNQRLQEIQKRISEGFYNNQQVLERVVDSLMKDIE